ncbi:DUF2807 domain-containing protein [uncultured Alistipes sp.]|jgi:hypothetical protein|uniref:GIN domain-containing protein n=1 Tax=uncultured Alistipes sp. TaxID=538949 RepID=UPI0025F00C95|nr:DUF2807 domain-containing protein [uncultured Alistipes sp.]
MKRMILSVAMLAFATLGYAQETDSTTVAATETAVSTERNEWLPTFESIAVDAELDIKFIRVPETDAPKIIYDTKGSYTSKFRAEVKDKVLRVTEKADARRPERTQVTIYYNSLRTISLSGGVNATFEGEIEATLLDLTVSRKSSLTASMNVRDLNMELTGNSTANLSGSVRYLSLYASTGRVIAPEMEIMSAEVNAQSKAEVSLWITDRFIGKTTTNGKISYKGTPQVVRGGAKFMGGEISRVE